MPLCKKCGKDHPKTVTLRDLGYPIEYHEYRNRISAVRAYNSVTKKYEVIARFVKGKRIPA